MQTDYLGPGFETVLQGEGLTFGGVEEVAYLIVYCCTGVAKEEGGVDTEVLGAEPSLSIYTAGLLGLSHLDGA